MFLGQGARIPIQAIYFILIARSLGVQAYGAFVGVTALVAILAPFGSLGSGNILIKNVSRNESSFPEYWGKALVLTSLSGTLLVIFAVLLSILLLPASIPFALILSISIADLIFARLLDIAAQGYQAFQRLVRTSQLMILSNVARLILLVGLLLVTQRPSLILWGYLYLAGIFISAIVGICLVNRELGGPVYDRRIIFSEIKEGLYFSVSLSSQNIYNDIDKTLLVRLATLDAAGIYGAAYRIIDVSFTPIRSLLYAAYAKYFQNGVNGLRGTLGFTSRLLPYAIGYAILASIGLFLLAPLLPLILGDQYRETVSALRWLSLLPLIKVVHYFAADSLTGAGFQGVRTICQIATAIINVMLILWLVPIFSWKGAAWASLISDVFLSMTLWLMIIVLTRQKADRLRKCQKELQDVC